MTTIDNNNSLFQTPSIYFSWFELMILCLLQEKVSIHFNCNHLCFFICNHKKEFSWFIYKRHFFSDDIHIWWNDLAKLDWKDSSLCELKQKLHLFEEHCNWIWVQLVPTCIKLKYKVLVQSNALSPCFPFRYENWTNEPTSIWEWMNWIGFEVTLI